MHMSLISLQSRKHLEYLPSCQYAADQDDISETGGLYTEYEFSAELARSS